MDRGRGGTIHTRSVGAPKHCACVRKTVGFEHSRRACWALSQTPPRHSLLPCMRGGKSPTKMASPTTAQGGFPHLNNEASVGHGVAGAGTAPRVTPGLRARVSSTRPTGRVGQQGQVDKSRARGDPSGSPDFPSFRRLFDRPLSLRPATAQLHCQLNSYLMREQDDRRCKRVRSAVGLRPCIADPRILSWWTKTGLRTDSLHQSDAPLGLTWSF